MTVAAPLLLPTSAAESLARHGHGVFGAGGSVWAVNSMGRAKSSDSRRDRTAAFLSAYGAAARLPSGGPSRGLARMIEAHWNLVGFGITITCG